MTSAPTAATLLPPAFFARDAASVARDLLGAIVETELDGLRVRGRITETEAYLGADDPASHAFGGRRHAQNAGIYSPPGHWYVYRSYGIHWCANVCCAGPSAGSAVLLRALEPLEGIEAMQTRRGASVPRQRLCAGPGCLTQALAITRDLDGVRIAMSEVRLFAGDIVADGAIVVGPRIGITRAVEWPLRFGVAGPWVSKRFT